MPGVNLARMHETRIWINEEGEMFICQENPGEEDSIILIHGDYIQRFVEAINEVIGAS